MTVGLGRLVRFIYGRFVTVGWPAVRAGTLVAVIGGELSHLLEAVVRLRDEVVGLGLHCAIELGRLDAVGGASRRWSSP
ncbi:hypothetical protein ACWDWO_14900 [Actinopolymorpha singaporensis]